MLAPGIIIAWVGTNATIPAGFTRETLLDGRFPKGAPASTNPSVTGGASTHTHTSPSHTHTHSAHSHTGSTSNQTHTMGTTYMSDDDGADAGLVLEGPHAHTYTVSTIASETCDSVAVTYASYSNDPSHQTVIYIKSTGYSPIPNNAVIFFPSSTVPSGFLLCDGNSSTANLVNKYLKGAGTGADADTTSTLGSNTNAHTIAHTHSSTHGHTGVSDGADNHSGSRQSGGNFPGSMNRSHTHPITLNTSTNTSGSNSSIGTQAETVEPVYKKLLPIQNKSGSSLLPPKRMIGLYLGTLASIPPGWLLCDGTKGTVDMRNYYMKMAASGGEIGNTGGANSHTHAAQGHTHTVPSHTHTGSVGSADEVNGRKGSGNLQQVWGGPNAAQPNHTLASVSSTTGTLASANTTADSSSNEPLYRTVLFLELQYFFGGSVMGMML